MGDAFSFIPYGEGNDIFQLMGAQVMEASDLRMMHGFTAGESQQKLVDVLIRISGTGGERRVCGMQA